MFKNFPKPLFLLLGGLFLLNIVQSIFTELIYDEAYYWYYAQKMDWGYFDHPPMVALMIKISSWFFNGELGVRFVSCLFGFGTAITLWWLIDNPKKSEFQFHFFLIIFALPLLNAYGFFTLPDTPLLFFTAIFLLIYKRFLEKETLLNAILMGITMAAMMYSKYHAALVIIFVLISNLRLLTNKYAWLALGVSLVCYVPHLYWLFENDFVTLNFHIYERPNQPYNFEGFTLGYLLNLVVIFGLLFPWMYWALFKTTTKNKFTRALLFLVFGFIIFFFVSSFNRRTQTQWVVVVCIPMVVLTYNFLLDNSTAKKWVLRMGLISMALLLYARLGLIFEPLFPIKYETHGNKAFAERITKLTGGLPVVFERYRRPSMYAFYSGKYTFAQDNLFTRYNQYSINDSEDNVRHQKVAYISKYHKKGEYEVKYKDSSIFNVDIIENFKSYRKLRCYLDKDVVKIGDTVTMRIYNPYEFDIPTKDLSFHLGFMNPYKQMQETKPLKVDMSAKNPLLKAKDTCTVIAEIPKPAKQNLKFMRIGILENGIYPGINSQPYTINGSN